MERWSSTLGFLVAAIGSAVGIGNIWRFSTVVGQNGGGAYLIPYLIAVFVFALPLMILELTLGQKFRGTIVSAFRQVRPQFHLIGWFLCAIVLLILSYYLVITGWTIGYIFLSFAKETETFSQFTNSYLSVLFFLVSLILTGLIVSRGIQKGIERTSIIMIPACIAILILLALYGTTLPGFHAGIAYFFTPDFSVLTNSMLWSAAFGQAFFSLSVGQGILLTYGTYMGKEQTIPRLALIIAVADTGVALLAGIVIFPIVFSFGLTPSVGAELAFTSLPIAFAQMPAGQIVAIAFFIVLLFVALTSAISMMEVGVAVVRESLGWSRGKSAAAVTGGLLILGLPSALSYSAAGWAIGGVKILDFMDETVGTLGLPIAAVFLAATFTWFLPRQSLQTVLGDESPLIRWIITMCKYVIPFVLIITTIARTAAEFDFAGTRIVPGTKYIGLLLQIEGIIAISLIILLTIVMACQIRNCQFMNYMKSLKKQR